MRLGFLVFNKGLYCLVLLVSLFLSQVSYAEVTYKVKRSDTLSKIVKKHYSDSKLSQNQLFIGLLAENPEAFRLGNINYLNGGAVLTIPSSSSLMVMEPNDAANLIAEHNNKAKRRSKTKIDAPFQSGSAKNLGINADLVDDNLLNEIANKQSEASNVLQQLDDEREALSIRMEQLIKDKKAMDAELKQLDELLQQQ